MITQILPFLLRKNY